MIDVEKGLAEAVTHFWQTRASQFEKQGGLGKKDAIGRASVTGGKHADGFVKLIASIVKDAELPDFELLERIPFRFEHSLHGERNSCIPAG